MGREHIDVLKVFSAGIRFFVSRKGGYVIFLARTAKQFQAEKMLLVGLEGTLTLVLCRCPSDPSSTRFALRLACSVATPSQ